MSQYEYTDKYGYRCAINITDEKDDIVVFRSIPSLSFDLKKYGIKIRRSEYYDYVLSYALKDGQIFLRSFAAHLSFFSRKTKIMGIPAVKHGDGKWSIFCFDDAFVDYSGTLDIGRTFDYRFWQNDDQITPVPFSPEVYKENGCIRFENGKIVKEEWNLRSE